MYYEDFGDGSPIVFVHGGAATHALWEQQVYALADEFRAVAYDLRGSGESDKPRDGYTVDRYADDLAELMAKLELEKATIVTNGFGGHITLRAAHRHPGFAAKLVLGAAAPWFSGNRPDNQAGGSVGGFSDAFASDLTSGLGADYAGTNWDLFQNWIYRKDPGTAAKVAGLMMAQTWPSYALKLFMRDLATVDHRPYLAQITQPALILHGVHDRKNRFEGSKVLTELLPHARLIRFEESSHALHFEERERFNRTIADFVRE